MPTRLAVFFFFFWMNKTSSLVGEREVIEWKTSSSTLLFVYLGDYWTTCEMWVYIFSLFLRSIIFVDVNVMYVCLWGYIGVQFPHSQPLKQEKYKTHRTFFFLDSLLVEYCRKWSLYGMDTIQIYLRKWGQYHC